jgi:hypothetical protein
MNLEEQLDEFWRESLRSDGTSPKEFEAKYAIFIKSVEVQTAHLPRAEQERLALQLYSRNAEYIAIGQRDRTALKAKLGLPVPSPEASRLAQVAVETAVRATIWQSIAAFFRAFR